MSIKMSECCTCGTTWRTGHDGSHSCTAKLLKENEKLKALVQALGKDVYDAYEWEAMTHSGSWEKDTPEVESESIRDYIETAEKSLKGDNNE